MHLKMCVLVEEAREKLAGGSEGGEEPRRRLASHACDSWMGGRAPEERWKPEDGGDDEFEERKTRWEPDGEGNEELDGKR